MKRGKDAARIVDDDAFSGVHSGETSRCETSELEVSQHVRVFYSILLHSHGYSERHFGCFPDVEFMDLCFVSVVMLKVWWVRNEPAEDWDALETSQCEGAVKRSS